MPNMTTEGDRRAPLVRIAILGGGMIAQVHRRAALLAGAEIVGVLDHSPAASRELAARWGGGHAFATIEEVVASGVDVIHICTPNASHAAYARTALEARINVVCEKPLGVTAAEANELADLARQAGVTAAVPFVYRFHPLVREIRERRLAGEFGAWHLMHGSYLQDWLLSPSTSNWRVSADLGGTSRAFADIGSHWCDLVEWVSGERIIELIADTTIAIPERPVAHGPTFSGQAATSSAATPSSQLAPVTTEDVVTMLLRTETGVPGSLTVSQVSAGRKNRLWFELDGQHASAVFDQENPERVWLGGEAASQLLVRDPGFGSSEQRRLSTLPAGHVQGWAQCFEAFVADVYAVVRGDPRDGLPTFADGARAARIVESVLTSARNRSWAHVD